jgi:hypothetical protein
LKRVSDEPSNGNEIEGSKDVASTEGENQGRCGLAGLLGEVSLLTMCFPGTALLHHVNTTRILKMLEEQSVEVNVGYLPGESRLKTPDSFL